MRQKKRPPPPTKKLSDHNAGRAGHAALQHHDAIAFASTKTNNNDSIKSIAPTDVVKTYRRYAPVYDQLFGRILEHGRRELASVVKREMPRTLLEIGVGTGLMLHRYPVETHVTGIDLSEDMLKIARHRAELMQDRRIQLLAMNAEKLEFPDESFDCVALPYVLSVTPNPESLVREIRRVCKKDGAILILNHFSGSRFWWAMETAVRAIADKIGFHADFDYEEQILKYDWDVQSSQKVNLMGLSRLVQIRNARGAIGKNSSAHSRFMLRS
jgi:phosphatidylethanolamine/phosphatidyl-N-methylethanolamine N-methyltransferase